MSVEFWVINNLSILTSHSPTSPACKDNMSRILAIIAFYVPSRTEEASSNTLIGHEGSPCTFTTGDLNDPPIILEGCQLVPNYNTDKKMMNDDE